MIQSKCKGKGKFSRLPNELLEKKEKIYKEIQN